MGTTPPTVPPPPAEPEVPFWWDAVWQQALIQLVQGPAAGWAKGFMEETFPALVALLVKTYLRVRIGMGIPIGQALVQFENESGVAFAQLAADGLTDYFGVPVAAGFLTPGGNRTTRAPLYQGLGNLVFRAIGLGFTGGGPVSPAVGFENAKRLVEFNLGGALEGWLEKIVGGSMLADLIPNYGDLDDLVSNSLGLGRLTRRALAPFLNALIVEPASQYANQTYTPALLSETQLARAHRAHGLPFGDYLGEMRKRGWSPDKAVEILAQHTPQPSRSEMGALLALGMVGPETVEATFREQGLSESMARALRIVLENDRVPTLRGQLAAVARDMFREREISDQEFDSLLQRAGFSAIERVEARGVGFIERSRPAHLPRNVIEEAYVEGVVDLSQVRSYYTREGFNQQSMDVLEALLVRRKVEHDQKAAVARPPRAAAEGVVISQGDAEELYIRGILNRQGLEARLLALAIRGENLILLVNLAEQKRQERAQQIAQGFAPTPGVVPHGAAIEEAYKRALVDDAALREFYVRAGYAEGDLELLMQLRRAQRDEWQARQARALARALAGAPEPRN